MWVKKFDIFLITLFSLAAVLFLIYPQIDIKISSFFYKEGVGFYLANAPFAKLIYKATIILTVVFSITLLILFIADTIFKKEFLGVKKKVIAYLLITLILGPGVIVNLLFKNNWGRARPSQIEQFGGDKKFTPAFIKTDQCEKNCSFTSGHAAAAFFFLALVPLFRDKKARIIAALAAISWGAFVGFVRILQGGHFLSDVVFSAFFVYFTARVVYYFMFERK